MPQKTALIIPCYNEELRLNTNEFISFVSEIEDIDLWFVNDGSSDKTDEVIQRMADSNPQRIFTHSLLKNRGKAEAIRDCILNLTNENQYQFVGYLDADLSAPIREVIALKNFISRGNHLIVAGSRVKMAGRRIERNLMRYYISRIFATYYSQLLNVHNYDTQCGLKLFDTSFAARLFESPFESRWLFDLELFLRAEILLGKEGYEERIYELPLDEWYEIGGSKVKVSDFLKAPLEVLKIYNRYRKQRRNPSQPSQARNF